jgi:arylsulfatase A-like enzyme
MVDDPGYGDVGVYGGGAAIGAATPNIDRLAREGLKLTSTYSQPTCTPTRSAIDTGRLPACAPASLTLLPSITPSARDDSLLLLV